MNVSSKGCHVHHRDHTRRFSWQIHHSWEFLSGDNALHSLRRISHIKDWGNSHRQRIRKILNILMVGIQIARPCRLPQIDHRLFHIRIVSCDNASEGVCRDNRRVIGIWDKVATAIPESLALAFPKPADLLVQFDSQILNLLVCLRPDNRSRRSRGFLKRCTRHICFSDCTPALPSIIDTNRSSRLHSIRLLFLKRNTQTQRRDRKRISISTWREYAIAVRHGIRFTDAVTDCLRQGLSRCIG